MTNEEYERERERIKKYRDYQEEIETLSLIKQRKDNLRINYYIGYSVENFPDSINEKIKENILNIIEDRIKECWNEADKI